PSPRMGGLQANSGGVCRVEVRLFHRFQSGRVGASDPRAAVQSQKPALRDGSRLILFYSRGESRLGVRPSIDNRTAGGASACPWVIESPHPRPDFAMIAGGQHAAPLRQAELLLQINMLQSVRLS